MHEYECSSCRQVCFFLLSTVNLHHVPKVQRSVTMLPISQSLMLSHRIHKYNSEIQSQSKSHRGTYTQTEWPLVWLPAAGDDGTGEIGVPGDYDLHCRATHDAPGLRHGRRKQGSVLWAAYAGYGRRIQRPDGCECRSIRERRRRE